MKNLKLFALLAIVLLFNVSGALSQNVNVIGRVFDVSDRSDVSGAYVTIKGTSCGTTTDVQGQFTITTKPSAILIVSYVGYITQEIPLNGNHRITVGLMPDAALDERKAESGNSGCFSYSANPSAQNKGFVFQTNFTGK